MFEKAAPGLNTAGLTIGSLAGFSHMPEFEVTILQKIEDSDIGIFTRKSIEIMYLYCEAPRMVNKQVEMTIIELKDVET